MVQASSIYWENLKLNQAVVVNDDTSNNNNNNKYTVDNKYKDVVYTRITVTDRTTLVVWPAAQSSVL
jgi:hypothetical protein